ncbi:TPA: transposase [Enterococcus faecium]|nr:transposase [Enterococcus faecium]
MDYSFVMCNSLYTKVRENQRVVSNGVYIT